MSIFTKLFTKEKNVIVQPTNQNKPTPSVYCILCNQRINTQNYKHNCTFRI